MGFLTFFSVVHLVWQHGPCASARLLAVNFYVKVVMKRCRRIPVWAVCVFGMFGVGFADAGEQAALRVLVQLNARVEKNTRGRVKKVDLSRTEVTTTDLWFLKRLTDLEEVNLADTRLDDGALIALAEIKSLKRLNLAGTQVTNVGPWSLKGLSRLEELNLANTEVDDGVTPTLAGLKNLKSLDLSGTRLTTFGVWHLAGLHYLETLKLTKTRVGDLSVQALKKLKSLKRVELVETEVSAKGFRQLTAVGLGMKIIR